MKVRTDFVTNSSSSSFCIKYKDKVDFVKKMEKISNFLKIETKKDKDFYINVLPKVTKHEYDCGDGKKSYYMSADDDCVIFSPKMMGEDFAKKALSVVGCADPDSVWDECSAYFDMCYNSEYLKDCIKNKDGKKAALAKMQCTIDWYNNVKKHMPKVNMDEDSEKFTATFCKTCIEAGLDKNCKKRENGITMLDEIMNSDVVIVTGENYFTYEVMEKLENKFNIKVYHEHLG